MLVRNLREGVRGTAVDLMRKLSLPGVGLRLFTVLTISTISGGSKDLVPSPAADVKLMTRNAKLCLINCLGLEVELRKATSGSERYGELNLESSLSIVGVMGTLTSL
jgi:hypothetical protein